MRGIQWNNPTVFLRTENANIFPVMKGLQILTAFFATARCTAEKIVREIHNILAKVIAP